MHSKVQCISFFEEKKKKKGIIEKIEKKYTGFIEFVAHEFKVMHSYKSELFELFIHTHLLQNICDCSRRKALHKAINTQESFVEKMF